MAKPTTSIAEAIRRELYLAHAAANQNGRPSDDWHVTFVEWAEGVPCDDWGAVQPVERSNNRLFALRCSDSKIYRFPGHLGQPGQEDARIVPGRFQDKDGHVWVGISTVYRP